MSVADAEARAAVRDLDARLRKLEASLAGTLAASAIRATAAAHNVSSEAQAAVAEALAIQAWRLWASHPDAEALLSEDGKIATVRHPDGRELRVAL